MPSLAELMPSVTQVVTALREAGVKVRTAAREIARADERTTWVQRFIYGELSPRAKSRGAEYWDNLFPGLPPIERAERRIDRALTRATIAGVAAAGGATAAELISIVTDGAAVPIAIPLGLGSVGAEMLYTTALQIDLAFDLASIYGVPFAGNDVGEIATLLAMSLGVDLVREPSRHDKPGAKPGATKHLRVLRQMRRRDFAADLGSKLLQQSVIRNSLPIVGIVVSAVWNQIGMRRYARAAHMAARKRASIVRICRDVRLGDAQPARRILDGAWLLATADGELEHGEALALAALIDTLEVPERIAVQEASFTDDEEAWFEHVPELPADARDVLIDVLALVAVADGPVTTPERRFLQRLGKVLGREIDPRKFERFLEQLNPGEASPVSYAAPESVI